MLYRKVGKPILFRMDPERAHHLVIDGLNAAAKVPGVLPVMRGLYGVGAQSMLATELFGLSFRHPIGLAAGLDKNAKAVDGFAGVGFAFMEVGTVTPKGQPGNEQPRLFRLLPDEALINRMGFNNDGAEAMAARLAKPREHGMPIAVNIGKNKTTPNESAHEDYRACLQALYPHGDFFVVNISSPNTPDLRSLQHGDELKRLLQEVKDEIAAQAQRHGGAKPKPVLVKIAPDMSDEQLELTVATIADSGVDGIIATNTTISRDGLAHANAKETGGLSGAPLKHRSTEIIRAVYKQTGGRLPIVGSGGIFNARDAYDKIRAGASLVELYTALIYEGPGIVRTIADGLVELLKRDGYRNVQEAVGADHHT